MPSSELDASHGKTESPVIWGARRGLGGDEDLVGQEIDPRNVSVEVHRDRALGPTPGGHGERWTGPAIDANADGVRDGRETGDDHRRAASRQRWPQEHDPVTTGPAVCRSIGCL